MKLYPEDEMTKTLRNAGNHLPNKTVQHPSRLFFKTRLLPRELRRYFRLPHLSGMSEKLPNAHGAAHLSENLL